MSASSLSATAPATTSTPAESKAAEETPTMAQLPAMRQAALTKLKTDLQTQPKPGDGIDLLAKLNIPGINQLPAELANFVLNQASTVRHLFPMPLVSQDAIAIENQNQHDNRLTYIPKKNQFLMRKNEAAYLLEIDVYGKRSEIAQFVHDTENGVLTAGYLNNLGVFYTVEDETIHLWRLDAQNKPYISASFDLDSRMRSIIEIEKNQLLVICYGDLSISNRAILLNVDDKNSITKKAELLHKKYISSVEYIPQKNQLLSASSDKTAVLWQIAEENGATTITAIAQIPHKDRVVCAVYDAQRDHYITVTTDSNSSTYGENKVHVWKLEKKTFTLLADKTHHTPQEGGLVFDTTPSCYVPEQNLFLIGEHNNALSVNTLQEANSSPFTRPVWSTSHEFTRMNWIHNGSGNMCWLVKTAYIPELDLFLIASNDGTVSLRLMNENGELITAFTPSKRFTNTHMRCLDSIEYLPGRNQFLINNKYLWHIPQLPRSNNQLALLLYIAEQAEKKSPIILNDEQHVVLNTFDPLLQKHLADCYGIKLDTTTNLASSSSISSTSSSK